METTTNANSPSPNNGLAHAATDTRAASAMRMFEKTLKTTPPVSTQRDEEEDPAIHYVFPMSNRQMTNAPDKTGLTLRGRFFALQALPTGETDTFLTELLHAFPDAVTASLVSNPLGGIDKDAIANLLLVHARMTNAEEPSEADIDAAVEKEIASIEDEWESDCYDKVLPLICSLMPKDEDKVLAPKYLRGLFQDEIVRLYQAVYCTLGGFPGDFIDRFFVS